MKNPFRYFNWSPEIIRLAVIMYIRYPLSLRQVEDILSERGIDICHETVRFCWNRFGPMFVAELPPDSVHSRDAYNFPAFQYLSPVLLKNFPVTLSREFTPNSQQFWGCAESNQPSRASNLKYSLYFPSFSGIILQRRVRFRLRPPPLSPTETAAQDIPVDMSRISRGYRCSISRPLARRRCRYPKSPDFRRMSLATLMTAWTSSQAINAVVLWDVGGFAGRSGPIHCQASWPRQSERMLMSSSSAKIFESCHSL